MLESEHRRKLELIASAQKVGRRSGGKRGLTRSLSASGLASPQKLQRLSSGSFAAAVVSTHDQLPALSDGKSLHAI